MTAHRITVAGDRPYDVLIGPGVQSQLGLVLADAVLEKFGGDSLPETRRNVQGYLDALTYR